MKKDCVVKEVLDSEGNLMKKTSMGPENSPNNITKSTRMTDYNIAVGRQKFDDDFLGRFGFHFYESENNEKNLVDVLAEVEFEQYKRFLDFFVSEFSKENLKIWKNLAKKDFDELTKEEKKSDYYNAEKVIDALKKYIKSKKEETITEEVLTDKSDNDIVDKFIDSIKKSDDKEILFKRAKQKIDKILKDSKL